MSLKDRLANQTKPAIDIIKVDKEPQFYPANDAVQGIDSLGEIDNLFADDEINSISVMGAKNIFIERKGKKSRVPISYRDNMRLENIIRKSAQFHGLQIDETHPYVEFNHKLGINVCATLPPLSNVATMIIKCYKDRFANLKALTEYQIISKEIALLIEATAALKLNIIIAGQKNTLKTTLLSAIAKKVPKNDKTVVFDYSKELKPESSNIVTYDFKNYENKMLIEKIVSSNPDKVFINDCPDLSYFNKFTEKGFRGIVATYCTDNPLDVLQDIYLKKSDVIIFVERKDYRRLITSISMVNGSELENIFYLNENFEHNSSGIVPEFFSEVEQSGISINSSIFEADYKHTYHKTDADNNMAETIKKNINPDILKKFKKDTEI